MKAKKLKVYFFEDRKNEIFTFLEDLNKLIKVNKYTGIEYCVTEDTNDVKLYFDLFSSNKENSFAIVDLSLALPKMPLFESRGYPMMKSGLAIVECLLTLKPKFQPVIFTYREETEYIQDLQKLGLENILRFQKTQPAHRKKLIELIQTNYKLLNK